MTQALYILTVAAIIAAIVLVLFFAKSMLPFLALAFIVGLFFGFFTIRIQTGIWF